MTGSRNGKSKELIRSRFVRHSYPELSCHCECATHCAAQWKLMQTRVPLSLSFHRATTIAINLGVGVNNKSGVSITWDLGVMKDIHIFCFLRGSLWCEETGCGGHWCCLQTHYLHTQMSDEMLTRQMSDVENEKIEVTNAIDIHLIWVLLRELEKISSHTRPH